MKNLAPQFPAQLENALQARSIEFTIVPTTFFADRPGMRVGCIKNLFLELLETLAQAQWVCVSHWVLVSECCGTS